MGHKKGWKSKEVNGSINMVLTTNSETWECVCAHGEFPGECDITQCGLLLGVLLLLPAQPSPGEHDIAHTYTNSHRGDPHWAHSPTPPPRQCLCRCIYMCECCLPGCRPIKLMLSTESLSAGGGGGACLCQLVSQSQASNHWPPSSSAGRPITRWIPQEGSVTWVIAVALATGILMEVGKDKKRGVFMFV